ncbi:bacteriophage T4 gp5 trimerisation domain-containing protein [Kolteria novifilia]|uniref:bacteriophage T4 gp5 trimerisation domain-containing protein n=1 Tax=Kolteria novifilia TaxID=2527975 RepID=UPI003AF378BD
MGLCRCGNTFGDDRALRRDSPFVKADRAANGDARQCGSLGGNADQSRVAGDQQNRVAGDQQSRVAGDQQSRVAGDQQNRVAGDQQNRVAGDQRNRLSIGGNRESIAQAAVHATTLQGLGRVSVAHETSLVSTLNPTANQPKESPWPPFVNT